MMKTMDMPERSIVSALDGGTSPPWFAVGDEGIFQLVLSARHVADSFARGNLPEIEITDAADNLVSAMQIPRPANDNDPPTKPGGAAQMPVPLVA